MKLKFDTGAQGLETLVGSLEAKILKVVWEEEGVRPYATNRRIHKAVVRGGHFCKLSTVTTTTRRMVLKGLLIESAPHGIYIYTPAITENDLIDCCIERVVSCLINAWPERMETYLEGITFGYPQNAWNKKEV